MLSPYRRVLTLPGALAFSLSGLVARLPISMVSLGIVLLVSLRSGSYGYAGTVSAAYVIAAAVTSPAQGRLADRFGQHRALPPSITVFGAALVGLIVAVELKAPTPVPHLLAAVAGAALPQIGSCVRTRWAALLSGTSQLQTAYAFEAMVDESVFIVGPVLVTLLATNVHPLAGLAATAVLGLVGTYTLAAQRSTEPAVQRHDRSGVPRPPLGWRVLVPIALAMLCLGALFGSVEVVTVAFAREHGHGGVTGLLLATWALGSLLAGLITGLVNWKASAATRFRWGMLAMAVVMLPLPLAGNLFALDVMLFVAGFAISPTLVATMSLVESTVPASRLTEGISWVTTGIAAGLAPGAAIAGHVIDLRGASDGFLVPVAAGLLGVVVALATRRPPGVATTSEAPS